MQWEFIIALLIAVPIILLPAAFIWYLNIGGIYVAIREALKRRATQQQQTKIVMQAQEAISTVQISNLPTEDRILGK